MSQSVPLDARTGWPGLHRSGEVRSLHRLAANDLAGAQATPHMADRGALSAALVAYLSRLGAPKAALDAATRLGQSGSQSVVTGQQAGVLTGPAYTFSKAVTAINLAKRLDHKDKPVVPIFWVASQDHDTLEVQSANLLDLNETAFALRLDLPAQRPVGRIAMQADWWERIAQGLADFRGDPVWKPWVMERLEKSAMACIHSGGSVAEWFARIMLEVLGEHGLVVFDPLAPELAGLFAPHLEQELRDPLVGPARIEESALQLEALGLGAQLRRQAGATNLFLENASGERQLLRYDGARFVAQDGAYSLQDLLEVLKNDPARISPAAGLRPTLADAVLPNIVSVLGPSELGYQLQLLGVYEHHKVAQPLLWTRMSVTWLEPPVERILKKFGTSAQDYLRHGDQGLQARLFAAHEAAQKTSAALQRILAEFDGLREELTQLESGFAKSVLRTQRAINFHVGNKLTRKLAAALARGDNDTKTQMARLALHLQPGGTPQERHDSFLGFLMKFGPGLLQKMLALEPEGDYFLTLDDA